MVPIPNETIREFVISSHFNLARVQEMLTAEPDLLTVQYDWGSGNGFEDGLGAASHVGNRAIAEFFLSKGAPETICAAAMLGDLERVGQFLNDDPLLANARGAHGITVMYHAAQSGRIEVVELLKAQGCHEGYSHALHAAVSHTHPEMVRWLLENGAEDVNTLDYQGKTPLDRAVEKGMMEIATLLRERGAVASNP